MKPSKRDIENLEALSGKFDDKTVRTILGRDSGEGRVRIMTSGRLERLASGRGRLTSEESHLIQLARTNSQALSLLLNRATKTDTKAPRQNRSLRIWLTQGGKPTDAKGAKISDAEYERRVAVAKALRNLGVDPTEGIFYLKKE